MDDMKVSVCNMYMRVYVIQVSFTSQDDGRREVQRREYAKNVSKLKQERVSELM